MAAIVINFTDHGTAEQTVLEDPAFVRARTRVQRAVAAFAAGPQHIVPMQSASERVQLEVQLNRSFGL